MDYPGTWIKKTSYSHHQKSVIHVQSEQYKYAGEMRAAALEAERTREEQQEHFAQPRDIPVIGVEVTMQDQCSEQERDMWRDHEMNFENNGFDAGEDPNDEIRRKREDFNRRVGEHNLWSGVDEIPDDVGLNDLAQRWDEEEHDVLLSEVLQNLGLFNDLRSAQTHSTHHHPTDLDDEEDPISATPDAPIEWFPYKSKLLFLLDAVDNLPRLRISASLMRVLLWLLREVGVKNVPSFSALRKSQQDLRKQCGVPTVSYTSPKGNVFSFNDPRTIIANVSFNRKSRV